MPELDNSVPTSLEAAEQGSTDQAATLANQNEPSESSQIPTTIESQEAASASQVETLANTAETPAYKPPELQTIPEVKADTIETPDGYTIKQSDVNKIEKRSPLLAQVLKQSGYIA